MYHSRTTSSKWKQLHPLWISRRLLQSENNCRHFGSELFRYLDQDLSYSLFPHRLPEAKIIPDLSREALIRPDGTVLNICTTAALQEMLLFLKRAFWPFPWQTSLDTTGQGFTGAAEVLSFTDVDLQCLGCNIANTPQSLCFEQSIIWLWATSACS